MLKKHSSLCVLMHLRVKYEKGVLTPLEKINGFEEGEELDVHIDKLAEHGGAFAFLNDEEDLYSEADVQ